MWPSSTAGRFPTGGSTACFSRARRKAQRGSANSTRRWCSNRGSARRSFSAPPPGGSKTSRTTGSSSRPPPANRERCRSGMATARGGRSSSGWRLGAWFERCAACRPRRLSRGSPVSTTSTAWRPRACCSTSPTSSEPPRWCPTTARLSSNATATSWATGVSACWRRSAGRSWCRGRWPSRRASGSSRTSMSRPCGRMTGSW